MRFNISQPPPTEKGHRVMKLFAGRLDARREERGGERSQEGDRGVNKTQAAGPPGKVHFHFGNLVCRILKHGVQGVEGGLVHSAWRPGHSHLSLGFLRSARHPLSCIQASQRALEGGTGPELPCSHMGHRGSVQRGWSGTRSHTAFMWWSQLYPPDVLFQSHALNPLTKWHLLLSWHKQ